MFINLLFTTNKSTSKINILSKNMVRYGNGKCRLYSAIITKVSNALDTLVSGEQPDFQTMSEGLEYAI